MGASSSVSSSVSTVAPGKKYHVKDFSSIVDSAEVIKKMNAKDVRAWIETLGIPVKDKLLTQLDGEDLLALTEQDLVIGTKLLPVQRAKLLRKIAELQGAVVSYEKARPLSVTAITAATRAAAAAAGSPVMTVPRSAKSNSRNDATEPVSVTASTMARTSASVASTGAAIVAAATPELANKAMGLAVRIAEPILGVLKEAPYIKPVANALLMLLQTIQTARVQQGNCMEFVRVLDIVWASVQQAASVPSHHAAFEARKAALHSLASLLNECREFVTEFTSKRNWLSRLARASEDQDAFQAYTQKLMNALSILNSSLGSETLSAVESLRDELLQGALFADMEDSRQRELRGMVEAMGGIDAVLGSEALLRELSGRLSLGDELILRKLDQGVANNIRHEGIRELWKQVAGPQTESVEARLFIHGFIGLLKRSQWPPSWPIFANVADILEKDESSRSDWSASVALPSPFILACSARERFRSAIDMDADGRVSVTDVDMAFIELTEPLEDQVMSILTAPAPNNLYSVPNYVPRPDWEGRVLTEVGPSGRGAVAVLGESGTGKSALALAALSSAMSSEGWERRVSGAFFIDCREQRTEGRIVARIARALAFPTDLLESKDLLRRLHQRVKAGPLLILLDNLEDALGADGEAEAVRKLIKGMTDIDGLRLCLTSIIPTGLPTSIVPIIVVPPVDRTEALRLLRGLLHQEIPASALNILLPPAQSRWTIKEIFLLAVQSLEVSANFNKASGILRNAVAALPPRLATALTSLAVFPESFLSNAAEAVSGLKLWELDALVRQGLLDRRAGRYLAHKSVRKYLLGSAEWGKVSVEASNALIVWTCRELRGWAALAESSSIGTALKSFDTERSCVDFVAEKLRSPALLSAHIRQPAIEAMIKARRLLFMRLSPSDLFQLTTACSSIARDAGAADLVASANFCAACCLSLMGKYSEALEAHQAALSQRTALFGDPDMDTSRFNAVHRDVADSLCEVGNALFSLGRFQEALASHGRALTIRSALLGDEHIDVAESLCCAGRCSFALGLPGEAMAEFLKALKIRVDILGEQHPDTLESYTDIGNCLSALGAHEDALKQQQKYLQSAISCFGDQHPNTAASYTLIGKSLFSLGRFEESLSYHRRAQPIYVSSLGKGHPSTATSHAFLGECFTSLGRHREALAEHQAALQIRVASLGEKHPSTAHSYAQIGSTLAALCQHEAALAKHRKALDLRLACFGAEHIAVASSYSDIGDTIFDLGRYQDALVEHRAFLKTVEACLGQQHPHAATARVAIGRCLRADGHFEEALQEQAAALLICLAAHGEEHPDTASCRRHMSECLLSLGRLEDAWAESQKDLAISLAFHGDQHPAASDSLSQAGRCLAALGRFEEALTKYHYKSLAIRISCLGEQHLDTASSFLDVGTCLFKLGRVDEALSELRKASLLRHESLGPKHPDVAEALNEIGACLTALSQPDEALDHLSTALAIYTNDFGDEHVRLAPVLLNLASCFYSHGLFDETFTNLTRALSICTATVGDQHPLSAMILHRLGEFYAAGAHGQGSRREAAMEYYGRALAAREAVLPPAHPDLEATRGAIAALKT